MRCERKPFRERKHEGMEDLRIGIVGCGGIAFSHTLALTRLEGIRLAAVAEPKKENRDRYLRFSTPEVEQRMAEDKVFGKAVEKARRLTTGCASYATYERMLAHESLDAVLILTPHTFHHKQILDALDSGLHVLVEKPMVCTARHAEEVVTAARRSRKTVGIVYQRRAHPDFVYIKEAVESSTLGRIEYMLFVLCQDWYSSTKGTWRRRPKYAGGGQLMDSGSHVVDALLWLSGLKPKRVFARILHFGARVDVNCALIVEFASGAVGQVALIGKTRMPASETLVITGSEGAIRYECGQLHHYDGSGHKSAVKVRRDTEVTPVGNFVDAVRGRAEVMAPPECGLAVAKLTDAAFRSAKQGSLVNV